MRRTWVAAVVTAVATLLLGLGVAYAVTTAAPTVQSYTYTTPDRVVTIPGETYTQSITVPTVTETTTQTVTVTAPTTTAATTTTAPTTTAADPGTPLPTFEVRAENNNYSPTEGGKSFAWVQLTSPTTSATDQQYALPRLIDARANDDWWFIWQQMFPVNYTGAGPYSASKCQFADFQVATLAVEGGSSDPHGGWADAGPSFLGNEDCERPGTFGIRVDTTEYPLSPDPAPDVWHTFVEHVTWGRTDVPATTPHQGAVQLWMDGQSIFSKTGVNTLKHHVDGTPQRFVRLDEGYYITPGYALSTVPITWNVGQKLVVNPNVPTWVTYHTGTQMATTFAGAKADTNITARFSYLSVHSVVVPGMSGASSTVTPYPTNRTTADEVLPEVAP